MKENVLLKSNLPASGEIIHRFMQDMQGIATANFIFPTPEKVFIRGNVTVVLWKDGTRTKSTCSKDDLFDPVVGFSRCLCKKVYSRKQFEKIMHRVDRREADGQPDDIPF